MAYPIGALRAVLGNKDGLVMQRQRRRRKLQRPGGAQAVAEHAFARRYGQQLGAAAKGLAQCHRFGLVVERGAGAVGTGSTTKRLVFQTRRKYSAAENADD